MLKYKSIKIGNKIVANLYLFINNNLEKEELVNTILENIPHKNKNGYAGFRDKKSLKSHLEWYIFGGGYNYRIKKFNVNIENLTSQIEDSIRICISKIHSKTIDIFVFPTFDIFVKKKMRCVSGYTPWKNTILIYINPSCDVGTPLKETLCHEFAHAISFNYIKRETILDNIIWEGVAEHFREYVINGKKSALSKSISKETVLKILRSMKDKLYSRNHKLNRDIFYGTGKYPLWSGYTIGYFIVEDYLKKQQKINWNKIFTTPSKTIIKETVFNIS